MDRRTFSASLALAGLAVVDDTAAAPLAPAAFSAADEFRIWSRLSADLSGRTCYAFTTGTVWGFKPQADDLSLADFARRLYGFANCIARKARLEKDGTVRIKTQSWNFYLDPETNRFTTELYNSYTDRKVTSAPMLGGAQERTYSVEGPRSSGAAAAYPVENEQGKRPYELRVRVVGDNAFVTETAFNRLKPGDIAWWKLEGSMTSHACRAADLGNRDLTYIPNTWSMNLVAEWQTWMEMHGTPGHILFKGDGAHLWSEDQIPDEIRADIEAVTPGALAEVNRWTA